MLWSFAGARYGSQKSWNSHWEMKNTRNEVSVAINRNKLGTKWEKMKTFFVLLVGIFIMSSCVLESWQQQQQSRQSRENLSNKMTRHVYQGISSSMIYDEELIQIKVSEWSLFSSRQSSFLELIEIRDETAYKKRDERVDGAQLWLWWLATNVILEMWLTAS